MEQPISTGYNDIMELPKPATLFSISFGDKRLYLLAKNCLMNFVFCVAATIDINFIRPRPTSTLHGLDGQNRNTNDGVAVVRCPTPIDGAQLIPKDHKIFVTIASVCPPRRGHHHVIQIRNPFLSASIPRIFPFSKQTFSTQI